MKLQTKKQKSKISIYKPSRPLPKETRSCSTKKLIKIKKRGKKQLHLTTTAEWMNSATTSAKRGLKRHKRTMVRCLAVTMNKLTRIKTSSQRSLYQKLKKALWKPKTPRTKILLRWQKKKRYKVKSLPKLRWRSTTHLASSRSYSKSHRGKVIFRCTE